MNIGASQGEAGLKNDLATAVTVGKRKCKESSKTVLKKKVKTEKTPILIPVLDDVFDTPEDEPGSIEKAKEAFQWLVGPTNLDKFYKEFLEKKPLRVKRDDPEYYKTLFTTKALDRVIKTTLLLLMASPALPQRKRFLERACLGTTSRSWVLRMNRATKQTLMPVLRLM